LLTRGQGISEPGHAFGPARSAGARKRIEHLRRQRLQPVHGAGQIPQQNNRVIVSGVERNPGEGARTGAEGSAVASFLAGEGPLAATPEIPETKFVEGSGKAMNTIPPNDYSYWELINDVVQALPGDSGEPEVLGQLAAVGIVKGKPFAPDERMKAILEDAIAVGNAAARTLLFAPREEEGVAYYEGSGWWNPLFKGGYEFLDPPPQITPEGAVAAESDGARKLNSRIAMFYLAT
jgi:hypothetical protein